MFFVLSRFAVAAPIQTGTYELGSMSDAQIGWMKSKFDMIINSDYSITKPSSFAGFGGFLWTTYLDISTLTTLPQYLNMVDWAKAKAINPEEMLLHAKINFTSDIGVAWQGVDEFDGFEGKNGVLLETSPGVFSDNTSVAYNGTFPYVTMNSNIYIGYELPFDQANFTLQTPASELVGNWQYWNGGSAGGGWNNISASTFVAHGGSTVANTLNDGTSGMTQAGAVSFYPPSDWAKTVVKAGGRSKYFIRFNFVSAGVAPVIKTIKGDNWINDGVANHCRGWNESDSNVVNVGLGALEYNPNPPALSSAKFKYQSRVPTLSVNHFVFNIADFQTLSGDSAPSRTSADYLAQSTINSVSALPYSGMMYNDVSFPETFGTLGILDTDFVDKSSNSTDTESLNRYSDLYSKVKSSNSLLNVGADIFAKNFVKAGDFNLYEYFNNVSATGDQVSRKLASTDSSTDMCYDDYLNSNNGGRSIKGLMIYQDADSDVNGQFWDQSNRGPITALAKHLIGMNDNTDFAYFSNGNFSYSERDNFYYTAPVQASLTADITADTSNASKSIFGNDFSNFDVSNCLIIGSGDTEEVIRPSATTTINKTVNNNQKISTTSKIYFNHSAGEPVQYCMSGHFTTDVVPPQNRMVRWANWFPALAVDFGTPGQRNLEWALGADYGWTNLSGYGDSDNTNVWSRDFANALVLLRPNGGDSSGVDYTTPSVPIPLGGTYYRLNADGTTGGAITSIQLRRDEGAILMKFSVGVPDVVAPSAPSGLSVE